MNCPECGLAHEITVESRHEAYKALYEAQLHNPVKLTWREERSIYLGAVHDYYFKGRGKIE